MSDPAATSNPATASAPKGEVFGRYVLHGHIARGGMATVHIARLIGVEGFSRIVAAKRLHPQFAEDADFVTMFLDEAHIASKIHHPNVVPVLDVIRVDQEVLIVQEYVHGVPLDRLFKAAHDRGTALPPPVAVAILAGVLAGLHAAHETKDEVGVPLNIVHRDVSPQNVIVSVDGIPRLLDFGIAKARSSAHVTREGFFKGKIAYMSPEQLRGESPARTGDIYAAGVLLWEMLVGRRLHAGRGEAELFSVVLTGQIPTTLDALSAERASIPAERWAMLEKLQPVVSKALALAPQDRYQTAADMAEDLVTTCRQASTMEVARWVADLGKEFLEGRQKVLVSNEESWRNTRLAHPSPPSSGSLSEAAMSTSGVKPTNRHTLDDEPTLERPSGLSTAPAKDEEKKRKGILFIGAGVIALLLFVIAVMVIRGGEKEKAEASPDQPGTAATTTSTTVAATTPPAANTTATPAATTTTPVAATDTPAVVAAGNGTPTRTTVRAPAPVFRAPAPKATATHANVAATPPPPPPPPATTQAPSTTNCNPPFYFEGTKKVYKPGCI